MMDLTSKRDVNHDHQLISWAQKEVVKHTNNCEYAEWIIVIEDGVQRGMTLDLRVKDNQLYITLRILSSKLEDDVKYKTHISSARFKTLGTVVESDSYCERLFHIQELEKVLEIIKTYLHLYDEDKRIYGSSRFTSKKDTKILKDIDVKIGQLRVVHD